MPIDPDVQAELSRLQRELEDIKASFIPFDTIQVQPVDEVINSVTSGGTDGTIADFTDLSTYANDAAAIRNNIYQLTRSVKQLTDMARRFRHGA